VPLPPDPLVAPLPCLICERELEPAFKDYPLLGSGQPSHGVMCSTEGGYGSRVFDPGSTRGEQLRFNICDWCLVAYRERMVWTTVVTPDPVIKRMPGDPFEGIGWIGIGGD
jgi:hypothetical protein